MENLKSFYKTVAELLQNKGYKDLSMFCNERYMSDSIVDHDKLDGGIDTYEIELEVPVSTFSNWTAAEGGIENKESIIKKNFEIAVKGIRYIYIGNVIIRPTAVGQNEMPQNKKPLETKLHFEVQVKQGRRADYIDSVEAPNRYPCFILVFNWDWTDFDYSTWFCLFYFASEYDKRKIGELKIMNSAHKNTMDALPKEFDEPLDDSFCSVGIDSNYYIGLRDVLKDINLIKEVQHYLCDCSFNPTIYDLHRDESIFRKSLMRDFSTNEAFNEGQTLVMGINENEMYSFIYTFHPEYDTSLFADWKVYVPYKPLPFMRTIGIVGNNGVGKTQILSKFVTDLLKKNQPNFKTKIPLFKSLLVICSTPFDSYPNESQNSDDIYYKLCCLEQDKEETITKLKENLKEVEKRPTIEGESMLSLWKDLATNYVDNTFVNNMTNTLRDKDDNEYIKIVFDALEYNVNILSSGQLHILSLITYICANIHYRSLLIIDEPEVHLHPHITMEFIAILSDLLEIFKSYSIIATHTPLVVREMAGKNVYVMQIMQEGIPQIAPVAFETLGEDVSTLYRNLFGYDEKISYFKKMVDKLCHKGKDYKYIVKWFQRGVKLNVNALLTIRDAIEARDNA